MAKPELDEIIADLRDSLRIVNAGWNAWEKEFINSVIAVPTSYLSDKQKEIIKKLWDKL